MSRVKTKPSEKKGKKVKRISLPISRFINTGFRDYAVYVLTSRGIPSFEDGLTPVQRYILDNTPGSFTKTLSVVGKCIESGYHHGDMSLSKAISRLARPFGASLQMLEGYGFFGTEVSPEPAAARYTSVKLNREVAEIIKKFSYLNTKNEDGANAPFWLETPIGLSSQIIGIAVGYKSTILPRKIEDIKEYLAGKKIEVAPHFSNFGGTIKPFEGRKNSWIISAKIEEKENRIRIQELPPVMKYASILNKLDWLFSKFEGRVRVINNSNTKVNIEIVYSGRNQEEFKQIKDFAHRTFSIIVNESIVFIKDGRVLVYDRIEDYLDDFKWHQLLLKKTDLEYKKNWTSNEMQYNIAKKSFLEFILEKKRTILEIDGFLDKFPLFKSRLESLTSKKFSKDELKNVEELIKKYIKEIKSLESELNKAIKNLNKNVDPSLVRGGQSKKSSDLLESVEFEELDGIEVWNGEDIFEESDMEIPEE